MRNMAFSFRPVTRVCEVCSVPKLYLPDQHGWATTILWLYDPMGRPTTAFGYSELLFVNTLSRIAFLRVGCFTSCFKVLFSANLWVGSWLKSPVMTRPCTAGMFGTNVINGIVDVVSHIMPALSGSAPSQPICWRTSKSAQKRALPIVFGPQPHDALLPMSGLLTLHERLRTLTYNFYTGMKSPNHRLHGLLPSTREHQYNLCWARNLLLVACRTEHFKHNFIPWAAREIDWPTVKM